MTHLVKVNNMYKCVNCDKSYKLKDNYEKHKISCDLFHEMRLKTHDEFVEDVEELPSQREMFKLIKELASKCNTLEKEVFHLKQVVNIRQKKQIVECLNNKNISHPPLNTFTEWFKSWEVYMDDLQKIFENDLSDGIKQVIKREIELYKSIKPICAFSNKPNYLYVFDISNEKEENNEPIWKPMSKELFEVMYMYLNRKFMQMFIQWQNANRERIEASEMEKDQLIVYMIKLNGSRVPIEKRESELKKWLYLLVEQKADNLYEFI